MAGQWYQHWSEVPEFLWQLCPNFHPTTDKLLASPDTGEIYFDVESMQSLQHFRGLVGPTRLLSGYRSEVYNARKRGSPGSYHFRKIAFDIQVHPYTIWELERAAVASGFTGIGYYPTRGFIHVDRGPSRTWYGSQKDKQFMTRSPDIMLT